MFFPKTGPKLQWNLKLFDEQIFKLSSYTPLIQAYTAFRCVQSNYVGNWILDDTNSIATKYN